VIQIPSHLFLVYLFKVRACPKNAFFANIFGRFLEDFLANFVEHFWKFLGPFFRKFLENISTEFRKNFWKIFRQNFGKIFRKFFWRFFGKFFGRFCVNNFPQICQKIFFCKFFWTNSWFFGKFSLEENSSLGKNMRIYFRLSWFCCFIISNRKTFSRARRNSPILASLDFGYFQTNNWNVIRPLCQCSLGVSYKWQIYRRRL